MAWSLGHRFDDECRAPACFVVQHRARGWTWLESECPSPRTRRLDLPLGLVSDIAYDALVVKIEPGDLIVLYSDGVSEAVDPAGNDLGRNGLMNLMRSFDCSSAERLGSQLASAVDRFRGSIGQQDDHTIIVLRRNDVRADVWRREL